MHNSTQLIDPPARARSESFGRIRPHPVAARSPSILAHSGFDRAPRAAPRNEPGASLLRAPAAIGSGKAAVTVVATAVRPNGVRLSRFAGPRGWSRWTQTVTTTLRALGAALRRIAAERRQRQHERDIYRALRELDARTLRDLGFDPSEVRSVAAEVSGFAGRTRTRSQQALHGLNH
jgi:uncharacterized protein YjiS (DUF1127 family)